MPHDHDILAELDGYRTELAHAEQYGPAERAEAVREQLARVEGDVRAKAADLRKAAAAAGDAAVTLAPDLERLEAAVPAAVPVERAVAPKARRAAAQED